MNVLEVYNYWICIFVMMIGFYGVLAKRNLIKKVICLGLFQTGIFLFYISLSWIEGGVAPILQGSAGLAESETYVNPLPHVLILTAIVVSVSTSAIALAIAINIKQEYGTVESDEIREIERGRPS